MSRPIDPSASVLYRTTSRQRFPTATVIHKSDWSADATRLMIGHLPQVDITRPPWFYGKRYSRIVRRVATPRTKFRCAQRKNAFEFARPEYFQWKRTRGKTVEHLTHLTKTVFVYFLDDHGDLSARDGRPDLTTTSLLSGLSVVKILLKRIWKTRIF